MVLLTGIITTAFDAVLSTIQSPRSYRWHVTFPSCSLLSTKSQVLDLKTSILYKYQQCVELLLLVFFQFQTKKIFIIVSVMNIKNLH